MTLKVYYDEIDGELYPKLVLLPNILNQDSFLLTYSVESPFERFYQEDFHDELILISVSQGALTSCPFYEHQFDINVERLRMDLERQGYYPEAIYETDYFTVLVDDLQELLDFDVVRRYVK